MEVLDVFAPTDSYTIKESSWSSSSKFSHRAQQVATTLSYCRVFYT